MPISNAEKQRRHRDKLKKNGFVPVLVYVKPEHKQKIINLSKTLNNQKQDPK